MKEITKRQNEVLGFINSFIDEHSYSPSVRDIANHFNFSVKGAHDHLQAITRKGFLRYSKGVSRSIVPINRKNLESSDFNVVPLVGNVAAGYPLLADENIEEEYCIPRTLIGGDDVFALRVQGDSMKNAGIFEGDIIIVKKQSAAVNGEVVVALLEDEATVKRYFKEDDHIRLQPENDDYEPIRSADVKIIGKVIWIFRKI